MSPQRERLQALFGRPELRRLIERLNERRELGRPLTGTLTLDTPSVEERRAVDQLLRRATSTGASLSVSPEALLIQLRTAGLANTWEEVLEAVCGQPDPTRALAAANAQAWEDLWKRVKGTVGPSLHIWLDQLRRDGLLKRLSEGNADIAGHWVDQAVAVLRQMPFEDEPIASVAARLAGNSHALDPGSPLATIILRGVSVVHQCAMPLNAAERRELWSKAGVVCDELSAPVLVFNLVLPGASPLEEILAAAHAATIPIHVTTRLLLATSWTQVVAPPRVYVCENPSIVALAARQLGAGSAPIICVDGEPKTAAWNLLGHLRRAGTEIWYHGDFDWKGLAIASRVIARLNARPWRYSEHDYNSAIGTEDLTGAVFNAPWAPELTTAMQKRNKLVHEEAVADLLLSDLEIVSDRSHRLS
ncbi:TIGR02679 family protein [Opitutus terrae]|uniref:TIGR02679 family protein n=1 Tax=Opitutus terrae (strain DSM 11246 / JCM 15787 / PB90-1) TaxID=452637 RepID=B1ZSH0_OPITP|nr:TIGR02679 family protein [Opitutus terrae]ACB73827.1 conserved hypothetical protein [Opitutus terrae PB90-1]